MGYAYIKKNEEQEKAYQEVEEGIAAVKAMNSILEPADGGEYFVTLMPARGKSKKLAITPQEAASLIIKRRKKMVKNIKDLAEKNCIGLSDDARDVLRDIELPKRKRAEHEDEPDPDQMLMDELAGGLEQKPAAADGNEPAADGSCPAEEREKTAEELEMEELERLTDPNYQG